MNSIGSGQSSLPLECGQWFVFTAEGRGFIGPFRVITSVDTRDRYNLMDTQGAIVLYHSGRVGLEALPLNYTVRLLDADEITRRLGDRVDALRAQYLVWKEVFVLGDYLNELLRANSSEEESSPRDDLIETEHIA
jgi:hypothetical protein